MSEIGRTKLTEANQTRSLRTTVPAAIVRQFGLKAGSELVWEIMPDGDQVGLKVSVAASSTDKYGRKRRRA